MAEVLFFILGAVFSLMLLMALLSVLSAHAPAAPQAVLVDPAADRITPQQRSRPAQTARQASPLGLPDPARVTRAEREAYRTAHALELSERALMQIARNGETAAAKIASQTLRRLAEANEGPADRLRFARARLDLLALRPEPRARAQAQAALNALA